MTIDRAEPNPVVAGVGSALLFAVVAVAVTWPLASDLDAGIPLGTETVATVPLFNLWTLAWNVESIGRGYSGYWQAPIFHPSPDAFALSEPQPLTGLLAALLVALGASSLSAYNILVLAALVTNGWLATVVSRRAGLGWLPATGAGLAVLLLPFTHQELGVLQLVPLAGLLLWALAILRFRDAPHAANGLLLGLALAVAFGLSSQLTLLGVLAGTPAVVWLWWPRLGERRTWWGLAAGAAAFLLLTSPLTAAQLRATSSSGFERSLESVRQHSAAPEHYLTAAWRPLVPTPGIEVAERPSQRAFWPGALRLLLAAVALGAAWRTGRFRRLAIAGALLTATALVLSLGAHFALGELSLAGVLRLLPGVSQLRSYFRFALWVQIGLTALAALGLEQVAHATSQRLSPVKVRLLVTVLAALMALEIRPSQSPIEPLPPLDLELPWIEWILTSTEPDDVLAFVPFPEGRSSRAYLGTSQWMYWQLRHWRPMVNGYSGFFPSHFKELKRTMAEFPSDAALRALDDAGVEYCIVHQSFLRGAIAPSPEAAERLVPVFRDERHGLIVLALRP
ncbi:MAG: hypothetical protein AAGC60_29440 [Acidobacteriota bacterium]